MVSLLRLFSETAIDTHGKPQRRHVEGETDGDTVMAKNCTTAEGLQPLQGPRQSRGAARSKEQRRKMSKNQGMKEINHYILTPTSYGAHYVTEGIGRDGEYHVVNK